MKTTLDSATGGAIMSKAPEVANELIKRWMPVITSGAWKESPTRTSPPPQQFIYLAGYTYPGIPSTSNLRQYQSYVNPIFTKIVVELIPVPNLDDLKEKKKLRPKEKEILKASKAKQKINLLEKRLQAVEGIGSYGLVDAARLCLILDVVIPQKFKVPEFKKYDGTKCPKTHIIMYCQKMAAHAKNEKLLMHVFQDNLTGSAARWYVQLDKTHICS
ncbi:uncharacterized protein LOC111281556 [Durio zibethinus]|uniref:Uncharacterized protein LOC111281556 n=1 Tax=Durio zibethinus TaxID=66656 RepID=A0A6P5X9C8_DURZI|nr:uncharacterized protein LOC111281556 [Durio zibethinus]